MFWATHVGLSVHLFVVPKLHHTVRLTVLQVKTKMFPSVVVVVVIA